MKVKRDVGKFYYSFSKYLIDLAWIIENLQSRSVTKTLRVMERLKQVPVPPPPDCLRHIGAVLIDDMQQLRAVAGLL